MKTLPRWILAGALVGAAIAGRAPRAEAQFPVNLGWTATGDDSIYGRATVYDIRYSKKRPDTTSVAKTAQWWTDSLAVDSVRTYIAPRASLPLPSASGARDSATINVPSTGTWFIGLQAGDDGIPRNWSGISNIAWRIITVRDTMRPRPIRDFKVIR